MRASKAVMLGLGAAGLAAVAMWRARRWNLTWGATVAEVNAPLPGDDIVAEPSLVATRAITIDAPADAVWPWLAQLGYGRAGFYSYDVLENLIGLDIHSADHIEPEWQRISVGDPWPLAEGFDLRVEIVDPPHALVVTGDPTLVSDAPPFGFSWAFVVRSMADDPSRTRLVVRERYRYLAPWVPLMVEPVAWVSLVMSSKMLRGVRDRAERARDAASTDAPQ